VFPAKAGTQTLILWREAGPLLWGTRRRGPWMTLPPSPNPLPLKGGKG